MVMNPQDLSLVEAAAAIREGVLSPYEYVRALLERIDKVEPQVQAWVTMDRERVLEEARRCEAEARQKRFRGPLHGIPIGVKDIFYTAGLRTTMGSQPFAQFIPDHDARVVTKLKQAGALVLGKTVTTVFVFLDPGPTRNPWNLAHTPGGSSSGSAAAVAARMCPAAIGSQTVGSVGRPAGFNGLVSIVPTQSRISLDGAFPLAWSLDHVGGLTRSVPDLELLLDAISETSIERVAAPPRPRIGVLREYFLDNMTPETRTLQDALLSKLAAANFRVDEVRLPARFDLALPALRTIIRSEVASVHEQLFRDNPEAYGPKLRELVETGMLLTSADYLRARRLRRQYQRDMVRLFDNFDVLLTPAARGPAPEGVGSTGDPIMNAPWSLADFPTMTIPYALASNGLPVGVQLSAAPLQEGLLLAVGKAVESVVAFREQPGLQ
jgi:aspartyl-tRNA(Asn)/glutamyl-tRNA(Gln) amidotransferase subunit A